jgi:hypothetical protein
MFGTVQTRPRWVRSWGRTDGARTQKVLQSAAEEPCRQSSSSLEVWQSWWGPGPRWNKQFARAAGSRAQGPRRLAGNQDLASLEV